MMIRTLATAGVAVMLAALLADCSGGGGGSVTPNAPQPTNPVATATAPATPPLPALVPLTVALTLPGPSTSTSSTARSPEYVSPNTGSFSVVQTSLNGSPYAGTPTVAQVGSGANCTGTTTLTCTASLLVPYGTDGFTVTSYDGTNGSGNVLSTGTATGVVALGFGNLLSVTLDPVVGALVWVPTSGTCTAGAYCVNPLALEIEDATGAQIVGAQPFVNASGVATPVTISVPGGMALYSASAAVSASAGTCTGLTLSDPFGQSQTVTFAYTTFAYTGADQQITVPAGVTNATMSAWGSPGGMAADGVPGGAGEFVSGQVTVTPGAALKVVVGGSIPISTSTYGGGGLGGSTDGMPGSLSGSGGGLSSVSSGPSILVVAGGGGGGGYLGAGGGAAGFTAGSNGLTSPSTAGGGGAGAQQTGPGAGGSPGTGAACPSPDVCAAGSPGSSAAVGGGGNGGSSTTSAGGGGGGNGAYGGGGGASGAGGGGGGGGSSFVLGEGGGAPSTLGAGQVTIVW